MIRTVEDLLARIILEELPKLDAESIKHPGTVGNMYEGLTEHLLRLSLPYQNLNVVSGFAEDAHGLRSPQLDRMVVIGTGRPIPYTDSFVYDVDRIIAVIEVKKTLYANDFKDGYGKLQIVSQLRGHDAPRALVDMAFQDLTGRSPSDDPRTMPYPWNVIYRAVMIEVSLPARILLGYHGYTTARAFREAVSKDLALRTGKRGTGPNSMPTLVMNDRFPIVKNDSLPYSFPIDETGMWPVMMSSRSIPPVRALLEVLWSRIGIRFGSPGWLFGEDLELEPWERLFDYHPDPSLKGWRVTDHSFADLPREPRPAVPWEPVELTQDESDVAGWLCEHGELDLSTPPPVKRVSDIAAAVQELARKQLVGADPSAPSIYRLVTKQLTIVVMSNGKIIAGDNISGRLSRWIARAASKLP